MAGELARNFTNLPMQTLIYAPLKAAADSNLALAKATYDFVNEMWLDDKKKTRILSFDLERPIAGSPGATEKVKVSAPFAALATLPNIMIKTADVEFTMEVKNTVEHKDSSDKSGSFSAGGSFLWFHASVSGSVSSHSENTRKSDQSAKYDVKVHAEQAEPSEGMSRLAQVFASCVDPIPQGGSGK